MKKSSDESIEKIYKGEYLLPVLIIISLVISCAIVSSKKYFWNDELYSYYFLSDPSFSHLLQAFGDKINNTPFLYFGLGWVWDKIFGSSELSLRMFSSLGMGIACILVWQTLRQSYNFWATSLGTLAVFCTSNLILSQNAEARMYGLFMAVCAVGFYLFNQINEEGKISRTQSILNTFTHITIIHTHLFGVFYSAGILFSFWLRDRYFKIFRTQVYLSILISWLSIIFYIPAFLNQSDAGNPRAWLPVPTVRNLLDFISFSSGDFFKVSVLIAIILIASWQILCRSLLNSQSLQANQREDQSSKRQTVSLLIFAYTFLAIPIIIWVISRTIKPIFWDRYMIPSTLSWAILIAHISSILINSSLIKSKRPSYLLSIFPLILLSFLFLLNPIVYGKFYQGKALPGTHDNTYGYENLPMVMQTSHPFFERLHYSPNRRRYYFILDEEASLDPASGQFGSQEYKHMDAYRRVYPELFSQQILTSDEFLEKFDRFLILDYADYEKSCPLPVYGLEKARNWEDMHCPQWVEKRLLNNPNYQVTHLGDIWGEAILLIEKK